jgi:hypothetical protein
MTGEQKFPIPLDSPLDINSNDMLVKADAPKFAFNRQRLLGSVLQNSVRYESDGWIAGWYDHNFEFTQSSTSSITPPLGNKELMYILKRTDDAGYDFFIVQHKDLGLEYTIVFNQYTSWKLGSGTVARISDDRVRVVGTTAKNATYTLETNVYTGALESFVCSDSAMTASATYINGMTEVLIANAVDIVNNYILIRNGRDSEFKGIQLPYTRTAAQSAFNGNDFALSDAGVLSVTDSSINLAITAQNVVNRGTVSEYTQATMRDDTPIQVDGEITLDDNFWTGVSFGKLRVSRDYIMPTEGDPFITLDDNPSLADPRISQKMEMLDPGDPTPIYNNYCVFSYSIGVWLRHNANITYRAVSAASGDGPDQFAFTLTVAQQSLLSQINLASLPAATWTRQLQIRREQYKPATAPATGLEYVTTSSVIIAEAPLSSAITQKVYYIPQSARTGKQYPAGVYYSDSFVLTLKCSVPDSMKADVPNTEFFTLVLSSGTNWSTAPEELVFTRTITWAPNVETYYNRLNSLNFQDQTGKDVAAVSGGVLKVNVPICIMGFCFIKINTDDIIVGNAHAFSASPYTASDLPKCYRIDGAGASTAALLTFDMMAIAPSSEAGVEELMMAPTLISAEHPLFFVGTVFPDYIYPEAFILEGRAGKSAHGVPFAPSTESGDIVYISTKIQKRPFVTQLSLGYAAPTQTAYNSAIMQDLETEMVTSSPNAVTCMQTIRVHFGKSAELAANYVNYTWNAATSILTYVNSGGTVYTMVSHRESQGGVPKLMFTFRDVTTATAQFFRTFVLEKSGLAVPMSIVSQAYNKLTFNTGYGTVDFNTAALDGATLIAPVDYVQSGDTLRIGVTNTDGAQVSFVPPGIIARSTDNIISESVNAAQLICYFNYNGTRYTLDIDDNAQLALSYWVKDIRNDEPMREIYRYDINNCFMFIKQFWSNTIEVENYWYIDKNHVLELSKAYMTLYVRTEALDDWNGNVWQVEKKTPRSNFLGADDVYYAVSSAFKSTPVLFKLQATSDVVIIKYITNVVSLNWNNIVWQERRLSVSQTSFGAALSTTAITSYSAINAESVVSSARISATVVNSRFLLGLALTRGMQQWTINVSTGAVVTGYGNVGLTGSLTGGQIPSNCCGATGFNKVVYSVNDLSPTAGNPSNQCYGSGSSIWFVFNSIAGIVTHMEWSGSSFVPKAIDLNNNFVQGYESTSFASGAMFDVAPKNAGILDFLGIGGSALLSVIAGIASPRFWYMNVIWGSLLHISHSLGQYAYVWRNSLQKQIDKENDGDTIIATDKDVSFGRVEHTVTFNSTVNVTQQIFFELAATGLGSAASEIDRYAGDIVNGRPHRKGAGLSQFAMDNLGSTIDTAIDAAGVVQSMRSTLAQRMSLSMFYSIGDKTQCFAGPGFVNHNLVGQCVAQSVSEHQTNGLRVSHWVNLIGISQAEVEARIFILNIPIHIAETISKATGNSEIFGLGMGTGVQVNFGMVIAIAAMLYIYVKDLIIGANKACLKFLEGIASSLQSKGALHGRVNKHSIQLEDIHVYGDKPLTLFWPAFGVAKPVQYTNESIASSYKLYDQYVDVAGKSLSMKGINQTKWSVSNNSGIAGGLKGQLYSVNITCNGKQTRMSAPADMAVVEGITSILPTTAFKNEQIGVGEPAFGKPPLHDYVLDKNWRLGVTAIGGEIVHISCDDTKLIDGPPSNIVVTDEFCGIASSYVAMEVKRVFDLDYLRPYAVTPTAIALNINRMNVVQDAKVYHAFDGYGNRIVNWVGTSGMDKTLLWQQYAFQINDHFKRSNIFPPSEFLGAFQGPPNLAFRTYDQVANIAQEFTTGTNTGNDIPGENKNLTRYAIPVHSDVLSTLPAQVRMLAPYRLHVLGGVTGLVTDVRNTQTRYKAPTSVDFNINGDAFRATEEFICTVETKQGMVSVQDIVASAGLTFIGATTKEAFFYSSATRMYYSFKGSRDITKMDIFNRFTGITVGRWDFVNQEVMFQCLLGDNVIICRLDGGVLGELTPPPPPIYRESSGFKLLSVAAGTVYQGPQRAIVNRFVINEHMYAEIQRNKGRWNKLSREDYFQRRNYGWEYNGWGTTTPFSAVEGWTHNAFELVTAMLGISEDTDAKFEWSLTFAWSEQMEKLFVQNEYVTVNLQAETVTQGGLLKSEVTHLYLSRELFTQSKNAGYYTFQFQSNNGIGNRERLYIWCDGMIALEDLVMYAKGITTRRTQPLNMQLDVQELLEM